jgi:hypothetical protein
MSMMGGLTRRLWLSCRWHRTQKETFEQMFNLIDQGKIPTSPTTSLKVSLLRWIAHTPPAAPYRRQQGALACRSAVSCADVQR